MDLRIDELLEEPTQLPYKEFYLLQFQKRLDAQLSRAKKDAEKNLQLVIREQEMEIDALKAETERLSQSLSERQA